MAIGHDGRGMKVVRIFRNLESTKQFLHLFRHA